VLKTAAKTLLALLLSIAGPLSQAQEALSPRLQIGIGILPAIIAANQRLANDDAQSLSIYLVYQNNRHRAEQLRPALEKIGKIRRHELEIESLSMTQLLEDDPAPTSAIFLVEPVGRELDELLAFTERKRVLLFSPFVGDVERGIATGFRVTDKVLPMVNMTALKQSNIQLKAFFLRVAVKHE
jgi:hypothetical protein